MGNDEYVKQIDEESSEEIPLDNNIVNQSQPYQPGYFISNMGAPYGMLYTSLNNQQQQESQNVQHFNNGLNNFPIYILKEGQYIPVSKNNNLNHENHPNMAPIIINPLTTFEDADHTAPSLCLFLLGFVFIVPWIVNLVYIKSKNRIARGLAIASVCIFSFLIFLFLSLIIFAIVGEEETSNSSY